MSLSQQDKGQQQPSVAEEHVIKHLQGFFVDGVHRVSLDAGLPLALPRFVGEQITFHITETQKKKNRASGVSPGTDSS